MTFRLHQRVSLTYAFRFRLIVCGTVNVSLATLDSFYADLL